MIRINAREWINMRPFQRFSNEAAGNTTFVVVNHREDGTKVGLTRLVSSFPGYSFYVDLCERILRRNSMRTAVSHSRLEPRRIVVFPLHEFNPNATFRSEMDSQNTQKHAVRFIEIRE